MGALPTLPFAGLAVAATTAVGRMHTRVTAVGVAGGAAFRFLREARGDGGGSVDDGERVGAAAMIVAVFRVSSAAAAQ